MQRSSVGWPEPEAPSSASTSPSATAREMAKLIARWTAAATAKASNMRQVVNSRPPRTISLPQAAVFSISAANAHQ